MAASHVVIDMVKQDEDDPDSIIPTSVTGEWNSLLMIKPDKFQAEWDNDKVTAYLCLQLSLENLKRWKAIATAQCKKVAGIEYQDAVECVTRANPGESAGVIHMGLISRIAKIQVITDMISCAVIFHSNRPQIINFMRGKLAEVGMGFVQTDPHNVTFHSL